MKKLQLWISPKYIFFLLSCTLPGSDQTATRNAEDFAILHLSNCPEYNNLSVSILEWKDYTIENKVHVEVKVKVQNEVKDVTALLDLWKCSPIGYEENCYKLWTNLKFSDCCNKIKQRGIWQTLANKIDPPVTECPVEKGVYMFKSDVDFSLLPRIFSIFRGVWKFKVKVYDGDTLLICTDVIVNI